MAADEREVGQERGAGSKGPFPESPLCLTGPDGSMQPPAATPAQQNPSDVICRGYPSHKALQDKGCASKHSNPKWGFLGALEYKKLKNGPL